MKASYLSVIGGAIALAACAAPVQAQRHFDDAAFTTLFDGKTLEGWVTTGGRYDGKAHWSVEDGVIVGREGPEHTGGLLYTARAYSNFIFTCDVRMTYPFDSGVFVRMTPPGSAKGAQVTLDYRDGGEIGAVYSDGFLQHNPDGARHFVKDAWNHVEVWCAGRDLVLRAWLNGGPITDFRLPKGSEGFEPRGLIGIQVHGGGKDGGEVGFKDLKVLPLPEYDPDLFDCDARGLLAPTAAGREAGWAPLFDGASLSGWEPVGDGNGYVARDGVLAFAGSTGYLRTREDYRDFELRLDFKTARAANSGVFLRGDRDQAEPAQSGCEVQILDDFHWEEDTKTVLEPWQFTGSLYQSVAPAVKALHPLGEWNTYDIRYVGPRLRVTLNGRELYDVDTSEVPTNGWPPFAARAAQGFIGLQRHAGNHRADEPYVWFKNVFVRRL